MVWLKYIALAVMVIYFTAVSAVFIFQRRAMYFPDTAPAPDGFETAYGVEIVDVHVEGLGALKSLYAPAEDNGPIVLFFHGNGNSVYSRTPQFQDFTSWGVGFLAVEYPGYGGNSGKPNQRDILKTALANYDFLISKGYSSEQIIIYGHSLGTASAVYTAKNRKGAALILTAPFMSTLAMGQLRMPWVPSSLLMKDKFRSDLLMPDVDEPLLILHGNADIEVPYAMGKQLFSLHTGEKKFMTIEGAPHYLWNTQAPQHIRATIEKYVP